VVTACDGGTGNYRIGGRGPAMSFPGFFRGIFDSHCARLPFADRLQGDLVNFVEVDAN
jgi:hypothetical protein